MANNGNEKKLLTRSGPPSAPAANGYINRPPPPSYEESQRIYGTAVNQIPTNSYMPIHAYNASQQQRQYIPMPNNAQSYTHATQAPPPQYYQQHYVAATAPVTFNNTKVAKEPHVLKLAPGAKITTTPTGAVSIPPPPPGCAPTPAQYAAMQGQPVVVKKTKRSFF